MRSSGEGLNFLPLLDQAADVPLDLLSGDALGSSPYDNPMLLGLGAVQDRPETFPFGIRQAFGDPISGAVGHQDHKAARKGDLLGQSGSLVGDRVFGDLSQDRLL